MSTVQFFDALINGSIALGAGYVLVVFVGSFLPKRKMVAVETPEVFTKNEWADLGIPPVPAAEVCRVCGEPAEWPELCQEHWERYCSDEFWSVVPAAQEALIAEGAAPATVAKAMPAPAISVIEVIDDGLDALTIRELKALASQAKVARYSLMSKAQLKEALRR